MSFRIEQITVNGIAYRGPFSANCPTAPWRITAYLPSRNTGTSGQFVVRSWQTWGRYATEAECRAALEDLKARATGTTLSDERKP